MPIENYSLDQPSEGALERRNDGQQAVQIKEGIFVVPIEIHQLRNKEIPVTPETVAAVILKYNLENEAPELVKELKELLSSEPIPVMPDPDPTEDENSSRQPLDNENPISSKPWQPGRQGRGF